MNTGIRISTDFFTNHKTLALRNRLGSTTMLNLVNLWFYAAKMRPDGVLRGMSIKDIEIAADWAGEEGALVSCLAEVGFLDLTEDGYIIHQWAEHQAKDGDL